MRRRIPRLFASNAEVAGFEASLTATVEEAVANVEISKEKETAQARAVLRRDCHVFAEP
jgi:hypothetical protein